MKKIRYIENLTNEDIYFNGFGVTANTKVDIIESNSFFTKEAFYELTKQEILGSINAYDEDDVLMSEAEFYEYYNFMQNYTLKSATKTVYKIYDYLSQDDIKDKKINPETPPLTVDYKKGLETTLFPKYTFNQGFLVNVEYFSDSYLVPTPYSGVSAITHFNPVLKIEAEYHVGGDGYVSHRNITRTWQTINNIYDVGNQKKTTKYYNKLQARAEGVRRRTNIIDEIVSNAGGLILMTETGVTTVQQAEDIALPFLDYMESPINKYIKGNTAHLVNSVASASTETFSWLGNYIDTGGTTIQMYIAYELGNGQLNSGIYS